METFGLTEQERIDWLQRYIIIHSYIYYEMNSNILTDKQYDEKAKELVEWKNLRPDLWATSEYHDQFGDDWNGSTGMGLWDSLNEKQKDILLGIVIRILGK